MKDWDITSFKLSTITLNFVDRNAKEILNPITIDTENMKTKDRIELLKLINKYLDLQK